MVKIKDSNKARLTRHKRVRGKISGTPEIPRLNVFRSRTNIYAQIIDDVNGVTLAAAASNEKDFGDVAYATVRGFVLKFEDLGLLSSFKYGTRVKYKVVR